MNTDDMLLGFALKSCPDIEKDLARFEAYRTEMRAFGLLVATATDEQLDSMLPDFNLAFLNANMDPTMIPETLVLLRERLEAI